MRRTIERAACACLEEEGEQAEADAEQQHRDGIRDPVGDAHLGRRAEHETERKEEHAPVELRMILGSRWRMVLRASERTKKHTLVSGTGWCKTVRSWCSAAWSVRRFSGRTSSWH